MSPDFNQLDNFFLGSPKDRDRKPRWKFVEKIANYFPSKDQLYYLPKVLSRFERVGLILLVLVAIGSLISIPVSAYRQSTSEVPAKGGSWSEGLVGTPQHINPLLIQTNDIDSDLSHLVYAGLLTYEKDGKLIPELAESYSISDDGLEYTFVLRKGLRWHDGSALTADDVVFTIITAQNSDYESTQRINWQGVDVTKKDDLTIVFRLKNRYAQFESNATIGIIPKHIWENTKGSNFGLSENNIVPIGSGPYKILKENIARADDRSIRSMKLTAFDGYALGRPYIDSILFRFYATEQKAVDAFLAGDIQALSALSAPAYARLSSSKSSSLHRLLLPRFFGIFFNQNKSRQLSDASVRMALNDATDKQKLLQDVLGGRGTLVDSPLLPGIIDIPANTASYPFDLEKAKSLLDQAGWKLGTDGIREKELTSADGKSKEIVPLQIDLTTSNWPELGAVAQNIKSQWEGLGIRVVITILSVPEIQQSIKERNYSALLFGEVLGLDPDPFPYWHVSQKKDPGLNLALYDDKASDRLMEEARLTLDTAQRKKLYDQLQNKIIGEAPAVFLYSPDYLYIQPTTIKNNDNRVIAAPSNRFDNIKNWYIDTKREKR